MKKLVMALGITLILASCGVGGPEATVKSFFKHVEAGRLDDAAQLFSKATLATLSLEKLKQGLQESTREIDEKGGISKIEVLDSKTIGEVAEVKVKLIYGNEAEKTESLDLIKENGKWKLQPSGDK